MSYLDFIKKAYPESKSDFDQQLTIISRLYRPIGLKIGYLAWRIGFSGNAITAARISMVLVGFFFLTLSGPAFLGWRLAGFFLIWFSKVLDFSDGAVARASGKTSHLGHCLDELSDQPVSQGMSLSLVAYFSGYLFLIPLSIFLEFVIHRFGAPLKDSREKHEITEVDNKSSTYRNFITRYLLNGFEEGQRTTSVFLLTANFVSKLFKSDFMHLAIIPLFIAILNDTVRYAWFPTVCLVIVILYAFIALIRFIGRVRDLPTST